MPAEASRGFRAWTPAFTPPQIAALTPLSAARGRPPASRGLSVSHKRQDPIKYCRLHHMVYSPRGRQWITVPDDFIAELRQADFPVQLEERHCPQCYEDIYTRLKPR
jgi:hypothetical protein